VLTLQWNSIQSVWKYGVQWLAFDWMGICPSIVLMMKNEDFVLRPSFGA